MKFFIIGLTFLSVLPLYAQEERQSFLSLRTNVQDATHVTKPFVRQYTSYHGLCPNPWVCTMKEIYLQGLKGPTVKLRAGYLEAKEEVNGIKIKFRGNVLYFQGLGDSMLNHAPLFDKLTENGYRVIAFDYMGQGGSKGKMDDTRISMIPEIGKEVWEEFATKTDKFPKKTIIGWSTGGLAAYIAAAKSEANKIVLIAPGIAPNKIVGDNNPWRLEFNKITIGSLTTANYNVHPDPHLDPIKPTSPLKVPLFAIDLLKTAEEASSWRISSSIDGLVLLSGEEDSYVNARKTKKILKGTREKNYRDATAPHFKIESYEGALHEIDNERPEISNKAHDDIIKFINGTR